MTFGPEKGVFRNLLETLSGLLPLNSQVVKEGGDQYRTWELNLLAP
jgi:hypothetical protein